MKIVILMGISEEKLIQKLIFLDSNSTLDDNAIVCRSNEVAKRTTSAIRAPPELMQKKVSAIKDLAKPANIPDIRSFMGLVNQLTDFTPDIAAAAQPLRPLMSPKRKFTWTVDHDQAFKQVKSVLANSPALAPFDPALPTILQTDVS